VAETLTQLENIIRDVFVAPNVTVEAATTADDVPGWDSLGHARLLLSIEKFFSIKFGPLEARRLRDVGELAALVNRKIAERTRL
jgi:acyl carrier protein